MNVVVALETNFENENVLFNRLYKALIRLYVDVCRYSWSMTQGREWKAFYGILVLTVPSSVSGGQGLPGKRQHIAERFNISLIFYDNRTTPT